MRTYDPAAPARRARRDRRYNPARHRSLTGLRTRCGLLLPCLLAALLIACSGKRATPASPPNAESVPAVAPTALPSPAAVAATSAPPARATAVATAAAPASAVPAASGATPGAVAAAGRQLSPSRIETVKIVVDLLLDRYYKPLKSGDVLSAAWKGATGAARAAQVDAPKLTNDRNADWQAFSGQYAQLYQRAAGSVQGADLAFGAVQAMTDSLHDDHTYFLNPDDNARRHATDQGGESFVGIGVTLSTGAPFVIEGVLPGTPAVQAGLRAGDSILAVDGKDVTRASSQTLTNLLRGEVGAPVTVTVKRATGETADVKLSRAQIIQPAIETRLLPGGIGYIALHQFSDADARFNDGRNTAETLDAALQSFEQAGVKGWVFDVRGNPGGSSQTLSEVVGRFLPQGNVLVSTDRTGATTEEPVDGHLFPVQRPLALLVNGQSASSSDLIAATMKEYGRAHLVGQRTAGLVNGGLVTELPDGAAIQYTAVIALSGKQRKPLDNDGVTPDDTVAGGGSADDILTGGSDPQFERAKQWVLDQASRLATLPLSAAPAGDALPAADVQSKLKPFGATLDDLPAGPARAHLGHLVLSHPNELAIGIAADVTSATKLADDLRARHWQGAYDQFLGLGAPQPFIVEIDLYKDDAGAHDAVATNEYSTGLRAAAAPAKLGDETVAYQGFGVAQDSDQIVWRRGRMVFTVQYSADPGQVSFDPPLALAQKLDARAASLPRP